MATKSTATKTFDAWMDKVNALMEKKFGLSADDMVDMDYYSMYEDGVAPSKVVKMAMEEYL